MIRKHSDANSIDLPFHDIVHILTFKNLYIFRVATHLEIIEFREQSGEKNDEKVWGKMKFFANVFD